MNENSYLNPTNIQEESNSAISKLEKDNEAIRIAESSLNTFFNDNEIQSEAFASLRQQMSDYMAVSQAEAEENCQFITGQFNGMESALIYSNFDCSVNFVQCDMADNSQITIYAQTGENTADIIARVNEKLGIEITEDEVVTSPNDVDSLIEQLKKENPDNDDRYDEAINNK